ncbi:MAG: S9 family peptidase [Alphaproteobacteria bacterium]|nr:MAG: S9 family peptidase [Alphaproteobacteria bacterium]
MKKFFELFILAAALLAGTGAKAAETQKTIPAEVFAQLPKVRQILLSPDGTHIAYTSPIAGRINLVIASLDGSDKPEAIPSVEETDISWFRWVNNDRLVISYRYTNDIGSAYVRTALFSVHRSEPGYVDMAREPKQHDRNPYVNDRPQFRDRIIDMLPDEPDYFLLAIDSDFDGRAEIRRVNVNTGTYTVLTEGYDWIRTWQTDDQHQFRLGWGIGPKGLRVLYIDPDTNRHRELNNTDWFSKADIEPIAFTSDPHVVYALEPYKGSRRRLVTLDVLAGAVKDVIFEHPEVDVDGLVRHPETGAIAGYSYTDDMDHTVYMDPELATLQTQLDQWLPGGSNAILSMNRQKSLYIISHETDREKTIYILDMAAGKANAFSRVTPIPANLLAPTEKHIIHARDGLPIPTYLTVPPGRAPGEKLPLVVMPHGGPHARDTLGYDYWTQFLANRGYAVLRPNFRGSSGYGQAFEDAGKSQWGGQMQDDVTDATKWAIEQGIADPARICIVGGSYGGYAALMGVVKEPGLYRCAVSINGVANLEMQMKRARNLFGLKEFAETVGLDGARIQSVSPYHQAGTITAPVLIMHAKDDPVVPFEQGQGMYKKLKQLKKPVDFVAIANGDHFLDTEAARLAFLKPLEKFLKEQLGK